MSPELATVATAYRSGAKKHADFVRKAPHLLPKTPHFLRKTRGYDFDRSRI